MDEVAPIILEGRAKARELVANITTKMTTTMVKVIEQKNDHCQCGQ